MEVNLGCWFGIKHGLLEKIMMICLMGCASAACEFRLWFE